MLTTLLFIVIIILCKTFTKGFTRLFNPRLITFSKTKLNSRLTSTRFYDDEDGNDKRKKKYSYNQEYQFILPDNEETYYTLVWFNCEDCRQLLTHIKNENKKIIFIDGTYYFFDENDETNTPLFYKNDELIATDLFSIYEELFYSKIV
jgi:hypothetical protein